MIGGITGHEGMRPQYIYMCVQTHTHTHTHKHICFKHFYAELPLPDIFVGPDKEAEPLLSDIAGNMCQNTTGKQATTS